MSQKKVPDASGGKKKQAASAKKPAPRKKAEPEKAPEREAARNPHRREIGAAVCLLLSLFGIIGFFTGDGVFISFFARFLKALMGYGFYVAPFALLWCAYILAFHRGRPVILRVTCTLLLCPVLGAMIHLFAGSPALPFDKDFVKTIWASGLAVRSGGLIAGTLAIVLK